MGKAHPEAAQGPVKQDSPGLFYPQIEKSARPLFKELAYKIKTLK
jgi:hypothetical protein